jgi:serine/threonine protein kinase
MLMSSSGHCKLGGFGSCDLGIFNGMKTDTFVGTVPFVAPEVIITVYITCDSCIFV